MRAAGVLRDGACAPSVILIGGPEFGEGLMVFNASHRSAGIVALLLWVLAGGAGPLFAASCDQPLVSFQAEQLTISSQGCSLQQVLTAISRQTGIEVQVPASASAIPVFANLGPGDPKPVVAALLEGTPFNWSLATEGEVHRRLVAVVLTERSAAPEPAQVPLQVAATGGANATQNGKSQAGQAPPKNKATGDGATSASAADQPPDQPQKREIDDSALSKLPPLPQGIPSSMWQLFPDVAANTIANGGITQSAQSGFPTSAAANPMAATASPPSSASPGPLGCNACPVPPGVDPAIRNLYPPNLMQLIQQPPTPSNIQVPPPPPWLRTGH